MSLATIASALAYFEVDREEFFSKSRFTRPVTARQAVSYVMKTRDGISYSSIGLRLKRDHSTIIHAVEKVEEALAKDDELRIWVEAQMDLPPHSRDVLLVQNPYRFKHSPVVITRSSKPATPPLIIPNFQMVQKPITPPQFEDMEINRYRSIKVNADGNTIEDHRELVRIERGSKKLMKAILREHPERRRA